MLRLNALTQNHFKAFPRGEMIIEGSLEKQLLNGASAAQVEQQMIDDLSRTMASDHARGSTQLGPHRTDWTLRDPVKQSVAAYGSTGEQKRLLTGVILAQAEIVRGMGQKMPLVLLDDIMAHLDPLRQSALTDALLGLGLSCWLTGAEASTFAGLAGHADWRRLSHAGGDSRHE
jgi:DNA replication and repair protein RecF